MYEIFLIVPVAKRISNNTIF